MAIKQIQFVAPLAVGADILNAVFASLPRKGEESAWLSRAAALAYVQSYPPERADVGGYYTPDLLPEDHPEAEDGVVTMVTASAGRYVSCFVDDDGSCFWTVDFGDSFNAALSLAVMLHAAGIEFNVAYAESDSDDNAPFYDHEVDEEKKTISVWRTDTAPSETSKSAACWAVAMVRDGYRISEECFV